MNRTTKLDRAKDYALETLAKILDAVDNDYTDDAHKTDGDRSGVILGGIHNAKDYLTSDFLAVLEEARDALADYKKALEEYRPEPRKCWIALTVDTNESDPEYVAVASLFSTREKARTCIDNAIAEDTAEGGNWEPGDVQWNNSGDICEYSGGQIVHRVAEMTIQD